MVRTSPDSREGVNERVYPDARSLENDLSNRIGPDYAERFRTEADATKRRRVLVDGFKAKNPGMNGQADRVAARLDLNYGQAKKKGAFFNSPAKAPAKLDVPVQKVQVGTAEKKRGVLGTVWNETFGKRPVLSTIATAGLLAYSGLGSGLIARLQDWIAKAPDKRMSKFAGKIIPGFSPKRPGGLDAGSTPKVLPDKYKPGLPDPVKPKRLL